MEWRYPTVSLAARADPKIHLVEVLRPLRDGFSANMMPVTPGSKRLSESHLESNCTTQVHLALDPAIGFLYTVAESNRRLPSQSIENHRIVAVAAIYSFRSLQIICSLEPDARYLLNNIHQLINANHLAGAKINGFVDIAVHDHLGPLNTVIDKHEASRLMSISPNIDLATSGPLGFYDLPADGSRHFLPSPSPRTVWPIDIVVSRNATGQAEVLLEILAHPFTE